MREARGWLLLVGLAVVVGVLLTVSSSPQDSPEHSSNSDAKNGTSAVKLLAHALGHSGDEVAGSFDLSKVALLFVFTPSSPYTASDAQQLHDWVSGGGVLVYASEAGDDQVDRAFGVRRSGVLTPIQAASATPVLDGVRSVVGGNQAYPLIPAADQVVTLRSDIDSLGYIQTIGKGKAVVLADPLELCNINLDKADNGRMLADLLGLVPAGAPVSFDEYHHGFTVGDVTPQAWLLTPWGAAIALVVVAVFAGLILRGRAFGPRQPLPAPVGRESGEWTSAVGALLRRSGGRQVTLAVLTDASQRSVAHRLGLPLEPRDRLQAALVLRAPAVSDEMAAARDAAAIAVGDDGLVAAASRLHHLAFPITDKETT